MDDIALYRISLKGRINYLTTYLPFAPARLAIGASRLDTWSKPTQYMHNTMPRTMFFTVCELYDTLLWTTFDVIKNDWMLFDNNN